MTIKKGERWGRSVPSPAGLTLAADDAAARAVVLGRRQHGQHRVALGLVGGDLARTLGGGHNRFPGIVVQATVDLLRVDAGESFTWAVAHVVARRRWYRGEVLFATNAQFFGNFDIAPRAHPNDGRVDIVHVAREMSWRARWQARRRARTGTHMPHPQLTSRQVADYTIDFRHPMWIWVDGVKWQRSMHLQVTVEPDALEVYV